VAQPAEVVLLHDANTGAGRFASQGCASRKGNLSIGMRRVAESTSSAACATMKDLFGLPVFVRMQEGRCIF
jgi:hypothetical protein